MTRVRRERALSGGHIRLMVDGGWDAAARAALEGPPFDVLELHQGRYADFEMLVPFVDRISALWIDCECDSAAGLEKLVGLRSLTVGPPLPKGFDFRRLEALETLLLYGWSRAYAETLFAHPRLKTLFIEGYDGTDCHAFEGLKRLQTLRLHLGKLKSLASLRACTGLEVVSLAHQRSLGDITELASMQRLRELELGEALPQVTDLAPVRACTGLETLVVVGTKAEFADTVWLSGFLRLRVLRLQSGVVKVDWAGLLALPHLEKLAIVGATPSDADETSLRGLATQGQKSVLKFLKFGTKKRPAWLIEFAPPRA